MREIELTGSYGEGMKARIDDRNVEKVMLCKWHYDIVAMCAVGQIRGKIVKMQRYIMGIDDRRTVVLFRDGDSMNCLEENLEAVSRSDFQSMKMSKKRENGMIEVRGKATAKRRNYENEGRKDWDW